MTFALAGGPGLILSGGKSARVGATSFRIGHVATRTTNLMFELVSGVYLHDAGGMTLIDSDVSLLAGAQVYVNPSVWFRAGGGFSVHTVQDGTTSGSKVMPGPGGVFGVGIDLIKRHYFVIGLESFFVVSIDRGGAASLGSLCLGFSYY